MMSLPRAIGIFTVIIILEYHPARSQVICSNSEEESPAYVATPDHYHNCWDNQSNSITITEREDSSIVVDCDFGADGLMEWDNLPITFAKDKNHTWIRVYQCTVPKKPISEILSSYQIEGVKKLTFSRIIDPNNTYQALHFDGLDFVELLYFVGNNVTHLPENVFFGMPNLRNLRLNDNYLEQLPEGIFYRATMLRTLKLNRNRLRKLPDELFQRTLNLENLTISNNKLSTVNEKLFKNLSKLKLLDLSYNQLNSFHKKTFATLIELNELNLAGNHFEILPDHFCEYFPNLQIINLSDNHLNMTSSKDKDVSILENCLELRDVDLSNNVVHKMFGDWQSVLKNLSRLELSDNTFQSLQVSDFKFEQPNEHPLLVSLNGNDIKTIDLQNFEYLLKNTVFGWRGRQRYGKRPLSFSVCCLSPMNCDCRMSNFLRYILGDISSELIDYVTIFNYGGLTCSQPQALQGVPVFKLRLTDLYCPIVDCPPSCTCRVRGVDWVTEVDCANQGLSKLPSWIPNGKEVELLLSNNKLENLANISLLMSNSNITKLSLSRNFLKTVDDLIIPPTLRVLELDTNILTSVSETFIKTLNRTNLSVSLHNNPWRCDSNAKYLIDFVKPRMKHQSLIPYFSSITCNQTCDALMLQQLLSIDVNL